MKTDELIPSAHTLLSVDQMRWDHIQANAMAALSLVFLLLAPRH